MISLHDIEKIRNRDPRQQVEDLGAPYLSSEETKGAILDRHWEHKFQLQFSVPILPEELKKAHELGMLKKDQLMDGQYYWGICRNARVARWFAKDQLFYYNRWKGSWYVEGIHYPGDEETFELFDRQVGADIFCSVGWGGPTST